VNVNVNIEFISRNIMRHLYCAQHTSI